ncbi:MAG: UDP-N-acetylglucosamine pyrophosphorylase [Kiritimatiellae bacterium]|jgi:UDP-N-acetylglucosamine/UDP-N-acetylgalactosamine diphosphorylase|nr:UDP-N-acetylglucosamine pyrophosphorylase [Kiritimatiellia bacterium]MDD3585393.1 UDP-N-acetylglucosamine pyrophosphorylase [Kiritimatiellia bacterium]HON48452.1 UDP-N-acetylglucosamine pyrophosphorylase [Kiritimatiellia bacterium]
MVSTALHQLQVRGVTFLAPETNYVAPDVNPDRIASGVVIHPGCRLSGAELAIGPGCVIGAEAPATVSDCQLGAEVRLAGGFFDRATFLDGVKAGSGAHVRPGCLLEEKATIAHSVGIKQTVFMPWVTAGSLINFCDALVAGGTSSKDHSEIGSSYVHFNFTPHRDKATASLIGDVPRGVLLNQPPIFLGGQGGMVGPCAIAYGTVIPAGQIWRGDITVPGHLVAKPAFRAPIDMPYNARCYPAIKRVIRSNLRYIGNIAALDMWYRVVRARFMLADPYSVACYAGARLRLAEILDERMSRLDELAHKVEQSLACVPDATAADEHRAFVDGWPALKSTLTAWLGARECATVPEAVQAVVTALPSADYLRAIQSLSVAATQTLTGWLEQAVACVLNAGNWSLIR